MWKEFKEFLMRGNVIDLAVGVVIGGAFTKVVTSIVEGFITPLVAFVMALVTGNTAGEISGMKIPLGNTKIVLDFDLIINAIIAFVITGFVLFLIIKGVNKLQSLKKQEEVAEEEAAIPATEIYLKEIRDLLEKQGK